VVGFLEVVPAPRGLEPVRAPLTAPSPPASEPEATDASGATVEIGLGARTLRVPAALPSAELRRLIRAVEGA
jgi:hypothetical protein